MWRSWIPVQQPGAARRGMMQHQLSATSGASWASGIQAILLLKGEIIENLAKARTVRAHTLGASKVSKTKQYTLPLSPPSSRALQMMGPHEIFAAANELVIDRSIENSVLEKKNAEVRASALFAYFSMWANTPPHGGCIIVGEDGGRESGLLGISQGQLSDIGLECQSFLGVITLFRITGVACLLMVAGRATAPAPASTNPNAVWRLVRQRSHRHGCRVQVRDTRSAGFKA